MNSEKTTGKKKGILISSLAVSLAALMTVGGSFAYLRSTTQEKVNEFEPNHVIATIEETTGSEYDIIPGTSQPKDPVVYVDNTIDAYVYVEVTDNTQGLVTYEIDGAWTLLDGYENIYFQEVKEGGTQNLGLPVLKDSTVYYDKDITNEDLQGKDGITLTFTATAVQKSPFNDPVKAYLQTK